MTTVARRLLVTASRDGYDLNAAEARFLRTFVADLELYFGMANGRRA